MKMTSIWLDSQRLPKFPAVKAGLKVDVIVIGGGITGVTAAYLFKKAGMRVALLERERCGGVDTSYTTAHLTCVTDLRLHKLVTTFGKDRARAVWEAGFAAMDQIVANIETGGMTCDFKWVPGYLFATINGKKPDKESLKKDAVLARELGFSAEYLDAVPYFAPPGVKLAHQAMFHPLKYLRGLLQTIPGGGSHVFENSEATEFREKPLRVKVRGQEIRCRYLVLATHTPLTGISGLLSATLLQTKLSLYTSYVFGAKLPPKLLPEALFWDTNEPYHYLRVDRRRGFDYAIFGGEDHKTGQESNTEAPYARLKSKLGEWIPKAKIDHRWSGQVVETNDGLPFIGETAESQFVATGFSGNGMTFGTLSGMMAVDAFLGRKNPWAELFSPHRKKVRGGTWNYLTENKDYPYYLVRNWMAGAEGKSLQMVKRGHGKILNLHGKKVAAYRDNEGKVTLCSPICTHLKCIVTWNPAERTWDCPCHGSRFKPTGEVMSGPAEEDLEKIESVGK
jgi:glycine/D-amino acid oxidase-like deaminating enzyme/nitrite reductase/ring-hydroxylating ferredoxin subunit